MTELIYPVIEIVRLEENFKYGTFGVLKINKRVFCVTLEPADLLNRRSESNIPAQQYLAEKYFSQRMQKYTFMLKNVPGRSGITFHPGNTKDDTEGCILLGQYFGKLGNEKRAVLNSGRTFSNFMKTLGRFSKLSVTISEFY